MCFPKLVFNVIHASVELITLIIYFQSGKSSNNICSQKSQIRFKHSYLFLFFVTSWHVLIIDRALINILKFDMDKHNSEGFWPSLQNFAPLPTAAWVVLSEIRSCPCDNDYF